MEERLFMTVLSPIFRITNGGSNLGIRDKKIPCPAFLRELLLRQIRACLSLWARSDSSTHRQVRPRHPPVARPVSMPVCAASLRNRVRNAAQRAKKSAGTTRVIPATVPARFGLRLVIRRGSIESSPIRDHRIRRTVPHPSTSQACRTPWKPR